MHNRVEGSPCIEGGLEHLQVKTQDGKIVGTPNVVLATSSPMHHNLAIHSRQHPYRFYAVGLKIPEVQSLAV